MSFRPATRKRVKARLAFGGLSKSGKSLTALSTLRGIVGPYGRIAAIDTENGALSLYAGRFPGTRQPTGFDVMEINHYSPDSYIRAIDLAIAGKYDALLLDSGSQEWMGKGGVLEMVDAAPSNDKFFTGWKNATPKHNAFVQALVACPMHLIITLRQKAEYAIEKNEQGKNVPVKVGMQLVQREGIEYEFNLVATMDLEHNLRIQWSCVDFLPNGTIIPLPNGIELGEALRSWLNQGEEDWVVPQFKKSFYINAKEVISAGVERETFIRIMNLGVALDKATKRGTAKALTLETGKVGLADFTEPEAQALLEALTKATAAAEEASANK